MLKNIKRPYLIAFVLLFSVFLNANLNAQMGKFQSLYIYNICRFVDWPANFNSNEFVIGIVGKNTDLEENLKGISESKTIQNKKIRIKTVTTATESSM